MRGLRPGPVVYTVMAAVIFAALTTSVTAEDLKNRWYFGGNLSYLSTTGGIRSNAAIIYTNDFGDDGIPFTGDPNELQGCDPRGSGSFSANPFCDPRPDDLLAREATIQETFKYDITAGYGLTSWLSLQLDASYFRGDVGPIDTFIRETYPINTDVTNPTNLTSLLDKDVSIPVTAGEITQIPVSLTGVVRFRKDSPLNPYVGVGIGMIFVDMSVSDNVRELNSLLAGLRITGVGNEFGQEITPAQFGGNAKAEGRIPMLWPVSIQVDDAFEWHLMAGAEYFVNDRWSMIFDARYTFADQSIQIDLGGKNQVDLIVFPRELFRPDGSLAIYGSDGKAPAPLCSEANAKLPPGVFAVGCDPNLSPTPTPSSHVNPSGQRSPPPGSIFTGVTCPNVGDFDKDGRVDQCYNALTIEKSDSGVTTPAGFVVVQGGKIDLTAFSVSVGMRFHF